MSEPAIERAIFRPGDMLYMEGEQPDAMYLIHSGEIEIIKRDADGFFDTLEIRGPGQVLGELALTFNRSHEVGARANSECRVIVIKKSMLDQKLAEAEPFVRALYRILVRNLMSVMDLKAEIDAHDTEREIADLGDHDESNNDLNDHNPDDKQ